MGVRVHKSIGYTLSGEEFREHVPDNRKLAEAMYRMFDCEDDTEKFFNWVANNKGPILDFFTENFPWGRYKDDKDRDRDWAFALKLSPDFQEKSDLSDYVVSDNHDYDAKFLQIIPIGHKKEWFRYDDMIDWSEETAVHGQKDRIVPVGKAGLYPYLGMVRTKLPTEDLPDLVLNRTFNNNYFETLEPAEWSRIVGEWSEDQPPLVQGALLEHFRRDYRPVIPLCAAIVFFAIKDVFRDPVAAYNALRPAMAVYWV